MSWLEALEVVVTRTGHERYRDLCADTWSDHEAYRALMIRQAAGGLELAPDPDPASAALQAHVAAHPCGSC